MERITGPIHGYHLACYTVETPQGHFGYAKVCSSRPEHLWDGTPALAKVAVGPFPLPLPALVFAADKAAGLLALRARRLAAGAPQPRVARRTVPLAERGLHVQPMLQAA
jgi:hypothetical protein